MVMEIGWLGYLHHLTNMLLSTYYFDHVTDKWFQTLEVPITFMGEFTTVPMKSLYLYSLFRFACIYSLVAKNIQVLG